LGGSITPLAGEEERVDPTLARREETPGELAIPPTATVSGRVVDRREPEVALANVRVVLVASKSDAPDGPGSARGPTAITDEGGRFRIDGLPVDARYLIAATKVGYRSHLGSPTPRLVAGLNETRLVTLMKGTRISGFVRDEDGRPVGAAAVRLFEESFTFGRAPDGARSRTPNQVTQSAADGSYAFAHDFRWFSVEAVHDGLGSERTGELCSDEIVDHSVDFRLSRAASIAGRVLDDIDLPVAFATVRIEAFDDGDPGSSEETRTDGEGRFQFDQLSRARVRVFAACDEYATSETSADPGGAPVVVRLSRLGAIEGRIDPCFETRPDRYLEAVLVPMGREGVVARYSRLPDPATGAFRCDKLRSGDYRLLLTFDGHPLRAPELIGVLPGETVDVGLLPPAKPRSARGRVRFANGDPVRSARVSVRVIEPPTFVAAHQGNSWSGRNVESADDGWYVLAELPETPCDVAASWQGHYVEPLRLPPLSEASVVDLPDLVMHPFAQLTGTLRSRDGIPLVHRRVELRVADRLHSTFTNTKGVYRFDEVSSGPATIRVQHGSRDGGADTATDQEVVLQDGVVVTVDFEL
jgi:hypothetical protein